MFRRMTEPYRQALDFARDEAITWKHSYLGCEHLLIGLLRTTDSVAASILNEFKIDETKARAVLAEYLCPGKETIAQQKLPQTPRAKKVLKSYSPKEARKLHHRYIGTEHILLALLRDNENMAVKILDHLDIKPDQVQKAVLASVFPGE